MRRQKDDPGYEVDVVYQPRTPADATLQPPKAEISLNIDDIL